jgi:branched-chain amino acid transport system substrate-binding protein
MGKVAKAKGHKTAVTITWKYAAGDEMVKGFKEAFEKGGGKVSRTDLPFPNVEFQALLTEIARSSPTPCSPSSPAAARPSSSRTTPPPA